jgi:nitroimidazol reductase NimA-like FMN-containing flavoprotein (pyridoxamine 5'-phosphate oxidase superfamily)
MKEPKVERLDIPKEYGDPKKLLTWEEVRSKLEKERTYWVASVRPDGRPHVIPKDGVWIDDTWYYGGMPTTVHHRNLRTNPAVAMHIGGETDAVIVEGSAQNVVPPRELAQKLADITNEKYKHYGMENTAETYDRGIWTLRAERVVAWNLLFEDATRFTFD